MTSIKEFVKNLHLDEEQSKLLQASENETIALIKQDTLALETLSTDDAEKLSADIVKYVKSDKFLDELDPMIPPPLRGETKEQFVERALQALKKLLLKNIS